MSTSKEVLRKLNLGNSVAEFDDLLDQFFVETETFRVLASGSVDIVSGDKGTGKTALFRTLQRRYRGIPEMESVELITGFNTEGAPVFERLVAGDELNEGQLVSMWKAYIAALVGNWILGIYDGAMTDSMYRLDSVLKKVGLRSSDDSPNTVFNKLVNLIRRIMNPESAEFTGTITPEGLPIATAKISLGEPEKNEELREVSHQEILGLLNEVIAESDLQVWVVLDRLDEAFQAYPDKEGPALRALLRTYLDLAEFDRIKLKLFLRRDLFRRIIAPGFVNLTHVNARKIEIIWDDDDLLELLARRIRLNVSFMADIELDTESTVIEIFGRIFPAQVDVGERKPSTITWILSRIRDGNDIKPPRNLIDLVKKSQDAQSRREERESNQYQTTIPLIQADALKRGLKALSEARVEDTLLAEAGENLAQLIERFRGGRSEHNDSSLQATLLLQNEALAAATRALLQIGFLEPIGSAYKIPMLYRDGLNITQGKSF